MCRRLKISPEILSSLPSLPGHFFQHEHVPRIHRIVGQSVSKPDRECVTWRKVLDNLVTTSSINSARNLLHHEQVSSYVEWSVVLNGGMVVSSKYCVQVSIAGFGLVANIDRDCLFAPAVYCSMNTVRLIVLVALLQTALGTPWDSSEPFPLETLRPVSLFDTSFANAAPEVGSSQKRPRLLRL